jgi:hypothetical protein
VTVRCATQQYKVHELDREICVLWCVTQVVTIATLVTQVSEGALTAWHAMNQQNMAHLEQFDGWPVCTRQLNHVTSIRPPLSGHCCTVSVTTQASRHACSPYDKRNCFVRVTRGWPRARKRLLQYRYHGVHGQRQVLSALALRVEQVLLPAERTSSARSIDRVPEVGSRT